MFCFSVNHVTYERSECKTYERNRRIKRENEKEGKLIDGYLFIEGVYCTHLLLMLVFEGFLFFSAIFSTVNLFLILPTCIFEFIMLN